MNLHAGSGVTAPAVGSRTLAIYVAIVGALVLLWGAARPSVPFDASPAAFGAEHLVVRSVFGHMP